MREHIFSLNGAAQAWRPGLTVADAVREHAQDAHAVATALNGRFVARPARADTPVAPGDALLVFAAIVGG
ncbi:MAG: sulfur carrier protein ThiS [Burkholderiaceae bacterium]